MALVLGTNCGLCAEAPVADPDTFGYTMDNYNRGLKVTTTDAITIIEMGWYCEANTEEANFYHFIPCV